MLMQRILLVVMITCLAVLVGCESTPPPPPYVPQVNTITREGQTILDANFAQWLPVQSVRESKTNDGYSRVQVAVKNFTTAPIRASYHFDWMGVDGVVASDPNHSVWEKVAVKAGAERSLESIAPRKDCTDFKLSIKCVVPSAD